MVEHFTDGETLIENRDAAITGGGTSDGDSTQGGAPAESCCNDTACGGIGWPVPPYESTVIRTVDSFQVRNQNLGGIVARRAGNTATRMGARTT